MRDLLPVLCRTFALIATLALVDCAAPTTVRKSAEPAAAEREAAAEQEAAAEHKLATERQAAGKSVEPAAAVQDAAAERRLFMERQIEDFAHLQIVGRPLLRGSVALCGKRVAPSVAVFAANAYYFKEGNARETARAYGFGEIVTVYTVIDGTPAATAGLQAGDQVVAIDGWEVPTGDKAAAAVMTRIQEQLQKAGHITLTVTRDRQRLDLSMQADTICDYIVKLLPTDAVNALADGTAVYVTRGMLRFVETDQELALVIAHELAHNMMSHIEKKRSNSMLGSLVDAVAAGFGVPTGGAFRGLGAHAYSQGFESEADYVGLYVMALAGVPIDGAANFWRRMGVSTGSIKTEYGATHPGSAERFVAIENTIAEIHAKQLAGLPLLPNIQGRKTPDDNPTSSAAKDAPERK